MPFAAMFRATATPEHLESLLHSVTQLAYEARNEPNTIRYDFYQSEDAPLEFTLLAVWENEEDWRAHVAAFAHKRHVAELPENAWAIPPSMTRLRALE